MMKKLSKRLFGMLMAAVMLVSIIPNGVFKVSAAAAAARSTLSTGDIITYGSYPQTKVTDSSLITALNAQTLQGDSTVTYDGSKYKRVSFATVNSYQQTNGYNSNTVYWFKFEPIQWRVLSNTDGELFVMSEKIFDAKTYHQTNTNITWENCTLRSWLNIDFYNTAFNLTEQARIKTSTVVNEDNPWFGTEGGNNTSDKLFLLSYADTINTAYGFNSSYSKNDTARQAQGMDFSKSSGLVVNANGSNVGKSYWWLRTPGIISSSAFMVYGDGNLSICDVNVSYFGVRPAFKINLADITVNITFDANNGSGGTGSSMIYGDTLTAPTVKRAGYTFIGWSPEVPATVPETDTTYTAQWISNAVTTGDIITFGSYPQTKVTESGLLDALNLLTLDAENNVTYDGAKYKGIFFTQYTPFFTTGTPNASNSFQDDNGYYINIVYWFKFEPIQWRVLSNTNGELFVMADKILDSKAYYQDLTDVTWETCTMRFWLNGEFKNLAFNSTERARIKTSTVVNEDNPWNGTDGGNNTSDKLFLLSYADTINTTYGFNSSSDTDDIARRVQGTDFSKSNGLYVYTGSSYLGNSYWWLRTPGYYSSYACSVNGSGGISYDSYYGVGITSIGVRPAFKINLSSDIITSKSGTGCVVDSSNGFVSGLEPGTTSLAGYVDVAPGYELSYVPDTGILGTGTVVNVVIDGIIIESYTIIIYGDVNGDGLIDTNDADTVINIGNYAQLQWDPVTGAANIKAADLFLDGVVDENDYDIIIDVQNNVLQINQSTGVVH